MNSLTEIFVDRDPSVHTKGGSCPSVHAKGMNHPWHEHEGMNHPWHEHWGMNIDFQRPEADWEWGVWGWMPPSEHFVDLNFAIKSDR